MSEITSRVQWQPPSAMAGFEAPSVIGRKMWVVPGGMENSFCGSLVETGGIGGLKAERWEDGHLQLFDGLFGHE